MIKLLPTVIYDVRARDGTWCKSPYPGHPKGCPNFPRCPSEHKDFYSLLRSIEITRMEEPDKKIRWFAVVEEFDLKTYADQRKLSYPKYSERQARNLIYWQNGVRSRLRKKTYAQVESSGDIVLEIPEACGVNVFETMALVGVQIDRHPDIVRKIMMLGKVIR